VKSILHVIDSVESGGAETVFVQVVDGVRQRGYRSIAVLNGKGWVTDELRRRGIEPVVIESQGAFDTGLLRRLATIVREERVDLIHSHLLGSNVYCAITGLLTRRPVVATFHGMVDIGERERFQWLKQRLMKSGVSRFVTVSERLRDAILRTGWLTRDRTSVIYNGADAARYRRSNDRALRTQLGLDDNVVLVGSLGNMHPAKGYQHLIASAEQLRARQPAVHFVIAGEIKPHLFEDLRSQMERAGVGDRVHFIGFVTESAAFLAQLDLFLLPSISEGFSIATVEAMLSGVPAIATRCGGPEEIITDRATGLLVEPANPAAISRAIVELLEAPDLAARMASAARELANQRFTLDAMLKSYSDLYESLT
jgi:glycosyltransferase involved in cell wall biosynthesis